MFFGETIAPFIGRLILAWFFLSEAYDRTLDWSATVTLLAIAGVPSAPVLLVIALAAMVLGGLSLLLGLRAKLGAMALFAITIAASIMVYDYWTIADAIDRQAAYDVFIRNMAIAGGLLVLAGLGPGRFAFDNVKPARR